jgi:hypothetical protein
MASNTDICNSALMLLGHTLITSMTDGSRAATICNQRLSYVIDEVLRAFTWNCATARSEALAESSTAPSFGYDYKYALPSDCLRVLSMQEEDYKFKIEGRYLLTDESSAMILYIKRIASTEMDSLLLGAVAARLAADIAMPLTNSSSLAEGAWKIYQIKLDEAQTVDSFEGSVPQLEADSWVNARL